MITGIREAHLALVVLVVLLIFVLFIVVEVIVGVAGAPGAAVGLEEAHVGLEREGDRGEGAAGGRGGEQAAGESGAAERRQRRRMQLQQRHGREYGGASIIWIFICGGGGCWGFGRGLDEDEERIFQGVVKGFKAPLGRAAESASRGRTIFLSL